MIALRSVMFKGANMDDKRLAQDLERLMTKTLVMVNWDFEVDLGYDNANGIRPFYGQSNLTDVRLPNLKNNSVFGAYFFDGANSIRRIYLDSIMRIPNGFASSSVIEYVYAPSFTKGGNFFNNARATGAVFDMGQSRTCAEFLAAMPTSFENLANVWKGWTFRCSDGDVVWDGSAWVKS